MGHAHAPKRLARALDAAERVLSDHLGGPVSVKLGEILAEEGRRSITLRCGVDSEVPAAPRSVIVKQVIGTDYKPEQPAAFGEPAWRLFNEWAGLAFLTGLDAQPPHAPRFYGGDRAHGLIVLEDLGAAESLVEPFLNSGAAHVERALADLMTALGAMHAATAGRIEEFQRVRDGLGPVLPDSQFYGTTESARTLADLSNVLQEIGVETPRGWDREAEGVFDALRNPGPFSAYTHGDPCPDNALYVEGSLRLIDFEWGGFRHAMIDASYPITAFPSCWCAGRFPPPTVDHAMARYRAALAPGRPAALNDEEYEWGVVVGTAYWALTALLQFGPWGLREETEWGTATVRQRLIARLSSFAEVAMNSDRVPALSRMAGEAATAFQRRWPDLTPLPMYPACTT